MNKHLESALTKLRDCAMFSESDDAVNVRIYSEEAAALLAKIGAAGAALQLAASTFRRYEALHAAKPDPVKAASNAALAQQMEEALACRNSQPAGGGE